MKRLTKEWVQKAEADWLAAGILSRATTGRRRTNHDQVGFHCQQSAEKYLKAVMQETGVVIPRTHDLEMLVNLLVVRDPTFPRIQRPAHILTPYAVGFRYPGKSATKRQARAAIRHAEKVRAVVRRCLGMTA